MIPRTGAPSRRQVSVAVIIPVYNGADYVCRAIESALSQTVVMDEIIVIDDGSRDNTAEVVREYPVTFIQQPNAGPGAARNAGAFRASSEWLAFLDHDDLWHPEKTERQLQFASSDQVGVIYSCGSARDEVPLSWQSLWKRNIVGTPTGCMVRRKCFFNVGGFDTRRCLIGTEDHHLWLRIALTNWRFVRCPGRLYTYSPGDGSLSRRFREMTAAEIAGYTDIARLAQIDAATLRRKIVQVENHYIRECIGIRDLVSARYLIKEAGIWNVFPELVMASYSPSWAFDIRRAFRNGLRHRTADAG